MIMPDEELPGLTPQNPKTSPPSVYEIQKALHDKILQYKGGIKGVWKAIDPRIKYEDGENSSLYKDETKIKESAFERQVSRLMNKSPQNEKMTFGLHGNFFLLMNILEILGIKDISDLLQSGFQKPSIEAVIHDSNIRVEEIQKKLDDISESLEMSRHRTHRFPSIKVCRDWEAILMNLNTLINVQPEHAKSFGFNNWLLGNYHANIQSAYNYFYILKAHREYFAQDKLLHGFYKRIGNVMVNNFNDASIVLSPFYILYFALLVHKKFLSILLGNQSHSPFINLSVNEKKQIVENKAVTEITRGNLGKYLWDQNNDTLHHLKNILTLYNNGNYLSGNVNYSEYLSDTIRILFDIYTNHADYSSYSLKELIESIKSIDDLYSRMSLGEPHCYYISQAHIEQLSSIKQKLEQLGDSITRIRI
jgi:hypothetical protein